MLMRIAEDGDSSNDLNNLFLFWWSNDKGLYRMSSTHSYKSGRNPFKEAMLA